MLRLLLVLYVITLLNATNYDPQSAYDSQSTEIMQKHASDWIDEFDKALHPQNNTVDQQQIFRIWTRGLVYNYFKEYEKEMMEDMYIRAFTLVCNNSKIMQRMAASPIAKNGIPNPFQKIYRWSSSPRLKQVFHPLALKGNWDLTLWKDREQTTQIRHNQQILLLLKDDFSKLVTCNLYMAPSAYGFSKEYLNNLTNSAATWRQIEIALTIFQLTMDILPQIKHYYPIIAAAYVINLGNIMAKLTINNVKQAYRVINIISDEAPELVQSFMDMRQHLIGNSTLSNHTNGIEVDGAEILIAALRNNDNGPMLKQLRKAIEIFQSCEIYFKTEAANQGKTASRYQFSIRLFKEVMLYSKSLDDFYKQQYVISAKLILSMVKSVGKIIPVCPEIAVAMSEIFIVTYPELESELYEDDNPDFFNHDME